MMYYYSRTSDNFISHEEGEKNSKEGLVESVFLFSQTGVIFVS